MHISKEFFQFKIDLFDYTFILMIDLQLLKIIYLKIKIIYDIYILQILFLLIIEIYRNELF